MKYTLWMLICLALVYPVPASKDSLCDIQGKFTFNALYKPGDIVLGGIFIAHLRAIPPDMSFRSKPEQWKCEGFDLSVFQRMQAMIFAIEEINKDEALLPNLTLGYRILDNCLNLQMSLRAALKHIGGLEDSASDYSCQGLPPVVAIIGDPVSSHSVAISRVLGLFGIPLVSYSASCSCLSNKQEYPSFFRTIPSDIFQVKVMVEIIKHFGWTWVGAVGSDDDYGRYALLSFNEEVNKFGCIAFSRTFTANEREKMLQIIHTLKQSTAKVIVLFMLKSEATLFLNEIVSQNITGKQWIGSDSLSGFPGFAKNENFKFFGGTIGINAKRGLIPGFENHLLQIQPSMDGNNNLLAQFWETMFGCTFTENNTTYLSSKVCTGKEDILNTKTAYSDVSELRTTYNAYKAVYTLAYALHNLIFCESGKGPFENNACADIKKFQPWQLLHYLKTVSFVTKSGDRVAFDKNGDVLPMYDILNWQRADDGSVITKVVGVFDGSSTIGNELALNEDMMFWNFNHGKVPESVCSRSCPPGTRKATRKGEPVCCFDCIPCADGEISSQVDSIQCLTCSSEFWSNYGRNECVPRETEFLSFEEAMGITLTATALLGASISVAVFAIFLCFRNTPVVKANNSELSFLLLLSLTLCFLCSLCFIGKPTDVTCMLRHVMFGISFVLCISCILVKTIVVIMAFKATLPGNNMMKWFGVSKQRSTVLLFTLLQALICLIWLITSPPAPSKNTKYQNLKIILECDVGSVAGFACLLGYIGFLACLCFLLAFLARNLPDTFNEAKFITFSMLIFCAVWITFIPAYISSPGKYTVAVEVFAILASSFGLLVAIFAPKCYIILFKPEQNTKKALMGRSVK
ncbi:extracellular calcium-sensing receptor-like [Erpetoichthys calabaricus]|uniref:extracellular calcium-sensing receptor-like n=1 Tax=Erpetoichthys calabaricus TaxID=27687 RepID=UPI0022346ED9|nr:extracellular calcium-sensing receptor-like [Erpetoichthys calabaricus]